MRALRLFEIVQASLFSLTEGAETVKQLSTGTRIGF